MWSADWIVRINPIEGPRGQRQATLSGEERKLRAASSPVPVLSSKLQSKCSNMICMLCSFWSTKDPAEKNRLLIFPHVHDYKLYPFFLILCFTFNRQQKRRVAPLGPSTLLRLTTPVLPHPASHARHATLRHAPYTSLFADRLKQSKHRHGS